jgi:NADPH:quinone reductase-like Zn-dependent oxidoreductase
VFRFNHDVNKECAMRAIRVDRFGEPDVLVIDDVAEPRPAAGQVLVDVRMAGVAYGDVMVRSGRYPLPLPWIPGLEVGGAVLAIGPGTDESLLGRTVVATTVGQSGGYAERALATAARGELAPRIHARFGLEQAADAHRELEDRRSIGAIVLTGQKHHSQL